MLNKFIYYTIFIFFINFCAGKKYNNYTLYRVIPANDTHIEYLRYLDEFYDLNYWRSPGTVLKPVEFVINPADQSVFLKDAEKMGMYITTILDNVQKAFDQQTVKRYIRRQMDSFNWNNYFQLEDIYQWLKDLTTQHPKKLQLESIGKSYENRDIMSLRINLNNKSDKPKVIIEGGIHAREWISSAFVTYFINKLVQADGSQDKTFKTIAHAYEWMIIPVFNVDGYEYSHEVDRLWRKNRHGSGVDLNRNFEFGYGTVGISKKKESDIYCGDKAFSEKETQALANFIKDNSKGLMYYVSFHSYGQYMILPYAHMKTHQENFDEMYGICTKVAKKIQQRYKTKYEIGTAYDTVGYMTSGVSTCWVKHTFRIPYAVTFELRDTGDYGFALPPKYILPTCKETLDGLVQLFHVGMKNINRNIDTTLNSSAWANKISYYIVIMFNILLFIVIRFD